MNKIIIGTIFVFGILFNIPSTINYVKAQDKPILSHQQEIWLAALEFCESRGVKTAINPHDLDGTPSYYSFQFKPSTFELYARIYGVKGKISEYESQKEIVSNMIVDKTVNFKQQFPDCTRRLGRPPR